MSKIPFTDMFTKEFQTVTNNTHDFSDWLQVTISEFDKVSDRAQLIALVTDEFRDFMHPYWDRDLTPYEACAEIEAQVLGAKEQGHIYQRTLRDNIRVAIAEFDVNVEPVTMQGAMVSQHVIDKHEPFSEWLGRLIDMMHQDGIPKWLTDALGTVRFRSQYNQGMSPADAYTQLRASATPPVIKQATSNIAESDLHCIRCSCIMTIIESRHSLYCTDCLNDPHAGYTTE